MTAPPRPGGWDGLVVVCGAVPWDGPQMLDQHLASGLARHAPVLYVDPPRPWRPGRRGSGTGTRRPRPGSHELRLIEPDLALATPHVPPGHERAGMKQISVSLVRRAMHAAVRELGASTVRAVVLTSTNPYFGVFPEATEVYYASDDYAAGADLMGVSTRRLEREMRRRPAEADLVVAASPVLADLLRADGYDALLIPNGCDPEVFEATDATPPATDVQLGGPAVGFMGHLSDRIDVRYLEELARRGHPMLLVGPGPRAGLGDDLARVVARTNVEWVGPRPFTALPSYLRHIDVGLVPYTDTPFNHASFPLKALEYLSAGRPVLSTRIEAIEWLAQGHNVGDPDAERLLVTADDIVTADTPEAFADAAERLMAAGPDPAAAARRRNFARAHSWDQRFQLLADALELEPAGHASGPTRP